MKTFLLIACLFFSNFIFGQNNIKIPNTLNNLEEVETLDKQLVGVIKIFIIEDKQYCHVTYHDKNYYPQPQHVFESVARTYILSRRFIDVYTMLEALDWHIQRYGESYLKELEESDKSNESEH